MAEYNENLIKFGWLPYENMIQAIDEGHLNAYDICFISDTHEQVFIDENLNPIKIKSRLRVYGSVESAIEDIQSSSITYEGEVVSVRDGEKFIAYVVNKFNGGDWYISPVFSETQIDYNNLQNTPIKNISGTVVNPIILKDLEDGQYILKGNFITPKGTNVTSIVGDYIIVDSSVEGKKIKRICSDAIVDYTIDTNGNATSEKYATEEYIESKGYATEEEVDIKLAAFKVAMQEYIKDYVETTVSLLIKYLITQELDSRYANSSDIQDLFN